MSVVANYIGSLQLPKYNASLTGTVAAVYVVPASNKGLTLASFSFANISGGAVTCELYHYSGATEWLVWVGSVADDVTVIVSDTPIRLAANDEIRAKGASGVTLKLSLISQLEQAG